MHFRDQLTHTLHKDGQWVSSPLAYKFLIQEMMHPLPLDQNLQNPFQGMINNALILKINYAQGL